jgi:hypothetical protein
VNTTSFWWTSIVEFPPQIFEIGSAPLGHRVIFGHR